MKNRHSARARTSPLMFAPLLLGTIVAPAVPRVFEGRRFHAVDPPTARSSVRKILEQRNATYR